MAKVGKIELKINTPITIGYPLYYTQAKKFEVRELPADFIKVMNFQTYGYQTEAILSKALFEASYEYRKKKENDRPVILYRCMATTELTMNKLSAGHYQGMRKGISHSIGKLDRVYGAGICVEFKVCIEHTDGVKTEYFRANKNLERASQYSENGIGRDWKIIPHTPERQEFFENIEEAMYQMLVKMNMFFDLNSEDATNLIDSNQNLLN